MCYQKTENIKTRRTVMITFQSNSRSITSERSLTTALSPGATLQRTYLTSVVGLLPLATNLTRCNVADSGLYPRLTWHNTIISSRFAVFRWFSSNTTEAEVINTTCPTCDYVVRMTGMQLPTQNVTQNSLLPASGSGFCQGPLDSRLSTSRARSAVAP